MELSGPEFGELTPVQINLVSGHIMHYPLEDAETEAMIKDAGRKQEDPPGRCFRQMKNNWGYTPPEVDEWLSENLDTEINLTTMPTTLHRERIV